MLSYDYLDYGLRFDALLEALDRRHDTSVSRDKLRQCRQDRTEALVMTRRLYEARETKNKLSREFGERKRRSEDTADLKTEIERIDDEIHDLDRRVQDLTVDYFTFWLTVPNIPEHNVPSGSGEDDNVPMSTHSRPPTEFNFTPRDHVELGVQMGCMDFEQTVKISGGRFVTLSGPLAKLERVLGQFMLDRAVAADYREVAPPTLVNQQALEGTGQLPKFADDLFQTGSHYLIPTSEVSLTNLVRDSIIEINDNTVLKRFVALTPCYRREAGSAGRDTRGMLRQHQFNKVELISITTPDVSPNTLFRMRAHSETLLTALDIPFRTVELCSGDLGFSAQQTFDIEVWLPSQNRYREVASISNCGDFQARRMNARYRHPSGKPQFVHTLNGSALAVGRTLIAVMENNQTQDGSISIPQIIRPQMGGSIITPDGAIL